LSTQVRTFVFVISFGRPPSFKIGLVRKSSKGPLAQEQPQRLTFSSSDAHAIHSPFQKVTPEELGRPTSSQITRERNPNSIGLASLPTGVNCKPRGILKKVKFAAPGASPEGEVAQLEHERIVELTAQTERDRHIAQPIDELAVKSALPEQAEANANAVKAATRAGLELQKQEDLVLAHWQPLRVKKKNAGLVSLQAKDELLLSRTQYARALDQAQSALQKAKADADERSQRACKQIGQYETELAEVGAELQARTSELEASPLITACASALVRAG
jgi:hypothetical protein